MHVASGSTAAIEACRLLVLAGADMCQRHVTTGVTTFRGARNVRATSDASTAVQAARAYAADSRRRRQLQHGHLDGLPLPAPCSVSEQ